MLFSAGGFHYVGNHISIQFKHDFIGVGPNWVYSDRTSASDGAFYRGTQGIILDDRVDHGCTGIHFQAVNLLSQVTSCFEAGSSDSHKTLLINVFRWLR